MSLITRGSIHEGHEWFSDYSRGRRDFMCLAVPLCEQFFSDSRTEVPRYRSSPTSWDLFFCLSAFSSSEVLDKITSIRSKLPTAACWSRKEKRGRETVKPTCFSLLYVESDFGTTDTKSFTVFFARWGVKFDRQLRISAVELDNSTIESMCRRGERKACNYIVLWILISLLYYCLIWPLMSRCVTTQVSVNSQKHLIFTLAGNV